LEIAVQLKDCYVMRTTPVSFFYFYISGAQVVQRVRSLDITAHTSLSPIWHGFAPRFVNYKKWCTRLAAASDKVILHKFIIGQTVAVAYSDAWYPGQVLQTVGEDKASVKFLHPCSEHSDIFQWPHKDDISIIENLFVFSANFDINPRDRMGRTWSIQDISELRTKYEDFCALYFE
jgi:hypothetical protein